MHGLRHTNASLLTAQGVDVRTVASLLGRAQASTTLDIYAHAFDKNKRETGYLILKVDSLSASKKAAFTSEEVCLARNAVNQLRNKKIKQGQYTDATDDMLLKLF